MLKIINDLRDERLSLKRIHNCILGYSKGKSSAEKVAKKSQASLEHRWIHKNIHNCILVYKMLNLLTIRYKDI